MTVASIAASVAAKVFAQGVSLGAQRQLVRAGALSQVRAGLTPVRGADISFAQAVARGNVSEAARNAAFEAAEIALAATLASTVGGAEPAVFAFQATSAAGMAALAITGDAITSTGRLVVGSARITSESARLTLDAIRDMRRQRLRGADEARARAADIMLAEFGRHVIRIAPVHTGRYLNAWIDAFADAGLPERKRPLQVPDFVRNVADSLDARAERLEAKAIRLRSERSFRGQGERERRAQRLVEASGVLRSKADLLRDPETSLERVIGGGEDIFDVEISRAPAPGGRAEFIDSGGRSRWRVVNEAAHARLVEGRDKVARRAIELARLSSRSIIGESAAASVGVGIGLGPDA